MDPARGSVTSDEAVKPSAGQVPTGQGETVVAEPAWLLVAAWVAAPLLGAGTGWLIKAAAGWAAKLPWVPWQGPLKLVASLPEPQATVGALAVGALAGAVLAFIVTVERLTVTVSANRVTRTRGDGTSHTVEGAIITSVFVDRKRLVLLGPAGARNGARTASSKPSPSRSPDAHGIPSVEPSSSAL